MSDHFVSVRLCVRLSVSLCLCFCLFTCLCLCLFMCVCLSICLCSCLSICLCICLSICLSVCLCVCLSAYASMYPSVCVSLSVCFALKAIAVVALQLLWFEKQDPASLLTHILPDTHVSSLSTPAKAKLPHGLRPPAARGLGGPAALSPTGGRGGGGRERAAASRNPLVATR